MRDAKRGKTRAPGFAQQRGTVRALLSVTG